MSTAMRSASPQQPEQTPSKGPFSAAAASRYGDRTSPATTKLGQSGWLTPDFALVRNGYQIRVANGAEALKAQTAKLIERMYSARDLFPYGTATTLEKHETTIVACRGDSAVATLTLRLDAGDGLLADTLYSDEISAVRASGGKVCEITRLAMDPVLGGHDALMGMLQVLYVIARLTHHITDVFIEVHPRHAGFYERRFGYRRIGIERICPRVGAPAVLLHLCEARFDELIESEASRSKHKPRRHYPLFPTHSELARLQRILLED